MEKDETGEIGHKSGGDLPRVVGFCIRRGRFATQRAHSHLPLRTEWLKLVGLDIMNAYLTAKPKEKVFVEASTRIFKHGTADCSGCFLKVARSLFGLRSSGPAFHDSFF